MASERHSGIVWSGRAEDSPQAGSTRQAAHQKLERELLRKERALAETAALLVLSKKVAVIFNRGEDE